MDGEDTEGAAAVEVGASLVVDLLAGAEQGQLLVDALVVVRLEIDDLGEPAKW